MTQNALRRLVAGKKERITTITLNVPEKLNPLTRKMGMSLPLATDEITKDDEVMVVLRGGGAWG